jgi:hypothetical protein
MDLSRAFQEFRARHENATTEVERDVAAGEFQLLIDRQNKLSERTALTLLVACIMYAQAQGKFVPGSGPGELKKVVVNGLAEFMSMYFIKLHNHDEKLSGSLGRLGEFINDSVEAAMAPKVEADIDRMLT